MKKSNNSQNKTNKKLAAKPTSTLTFLPQFDDIELYELESIKRKAIEDSYSPELNPFQKESLKRTIEMVNDMMLNYSATFYITQGKLHEDTYEINYTPYKAKILNRSNIDFKIESWSELIIKIGVYDVTFQKKSTNQDSRKTLKSLGWYRNIKEEIIRSLSIDYVLKYYHIKTTNNYQVIKNAVSEIRNVLIEFFGDLGDPIEYNNSQKGWEPQIEIILLDAEEKVIATTEKLKHNELEKVGVTFIKAPDFNDDYQEDAAQDYLRSQVYNSDDEIDDY